MNFVNMEFDNLQFDQSKLLKIWDECKREVEEFNGENYKRDTREDNHRHDDNDMNQEIKFLKEKTPEFLKEKTPKTPKI